MTLTRTLEKLERFGDSEADRALRPPVDAPTPGAPLPPRSRRGLLKGLLVGGAAAVVVALLVTWLVAFSPLLGASVVQVQGATTLSADQVRTAAAVAHGTPLVRLDAGAVARRVQQLPQVASATVTVTYPSTVTVTVVERTPVLRLARPTRLVDATGLAYLTPAAGVPVPDGLPLTTATGDLLPVAADVAAAVPAAVRATVARVGVTAGADGGAPQVTLTLADGRTVVWGDTSREAEKGALVGTLFAAGAPKVPGTTIDVSSPEQVVTR